jgi:hypothetical protein
MIFHPNHTQKDTERGPGMVIHNGGPRYIEGAGKRIAVHPGWGKNMRLYLKNN